MPTKPSIATQAQPQPVRAGGLRWLVRADVPEDSLRPVLENPDEFLTLPRQQFKSTRTVTVTRVPKPAPGLPNLVLRRLNYGQLKHRLRDWLRPTRARRAFDLGLCLTQAGVATPRPVAVAEKRGFGWPLAAYLITEEIPGAQTLGTFAARHRALPAATVRQLADLLAQLHQHGFSHRDLKSTNVLLDEQLRPWLIDLDGVRFYGSVNQQRAAADFIRLAKGLASHPTLLRNSGWKFLSRYCACRDRNPHELAGEIVAALDFGGGWTPLPGGGASGQSSGQSFARTDWLAAFHTAKLRRADDFFTVTGEALTKAGLGTRYRARLQIQKDGAPQTVYLKRFGQERFRDRLRRRIEQGRWLTAGEKEKQMAETLQTAGIPVAEALAWGWRDSEDGQRQSFVVLSAVPGESLQQWAQNSLPRSSTQKIQMARRLAKLVRRVHEQGWRHRDFYLCHIFVQESAVRSCLTVIDLQRVFRPHWRQERWRVKDLAQLNYSAARFFSRTLRMRFLHRYFGVAKLDPGQKKTLRRVLCKTQSIARHDRA